MTRVWGGEDEQSRGRMDVVLGRDQGTGGGGRDGLGEARCDALLGEGESNHNGDQTSEKPSYSVGDVGRGGGEVMGWGAVGLRASTRTRSVLIQAGEIPGELSTILRSSDAVDSWLVNGSMDRAGVDVLDGKARVSRDSGREGGSRDFD